MASNVSITFSVGGQFAELIGSRSVELLLQTGRRLFAAVRYINHSLGLYEHTTCDYFNGTTKVPMYEEFGKDSLKGGENIVLVPDYAQVICGEKEIRTEIDRNMYVSEFAKMIAAFLLVSPRLIKFERDGSEISFEKTLSDFMRDHPRLDFEVVDGDKIQKIQTTKETTAPGKGKQKTTFIIMEHRQNHGAGGDKTTHFTSKGRTSMAPARLLGHVNTIEEARAFLGQDYPQQQRNAFDEITGSLCLYLDTHVQVRAYRVLLGEFQ